jgi:hypothetical protein
MIAVRACQWASSSLRARDIDMMEQRWQALDEFQRDV